MSRYAIAGKARNVFKEVEDMARMAAEGGGVYYNISPEYHHPGPWKFTAERIKIDRHGHFKKSPFDPARSRRLLDLSDKFECGYGGGSRGTLQFALAVLLDATGSKRDAVAYYREYAEHFLTNSSISINADQVRLFVTLKRNGGYDGRE